MKFSKIVTLAAAGALLIGGQSAWAASANACKSLLSTVSSGGTGTKDYDKFKSLVTSTATSTHDYSGTALKNPMWVTLVANDGTICAVATSGNTGKASTSGTGIGSNAWLLSRVISAQKANTSNGLSTDSAPMASGALYGATADSFGSLTTKGSLFGLQFSNPVDPTAAYKGTDSSFGTAKDPMTGKRIGGVNVFGGGLPLYSAGKKVGAIGVSGDTSCEDHSFAWKLRQALGGASSTSDAISLSTSGHPTCGKSTAAQLGAGWSN